ncbi:MAG: tetratricopeptide repeat protein [Myxococcales bacterium]|nr:tetratricopeptide repeat protein [Myxococcales bacterium]
MSALAACLLLASSVGQLPSFLAEKRLENPIVSRQKERAQLVTKLRRDIFKVDRSLGETERLIAKSRNAPYLPDLQFRLAELYVEKSRYVYYLQSESRPEGVKGALVSPETKLLKQKATQIYNRILREFPDFKDGDKVTFYLAHEQRELGTFDEMLKTLGELIRKYPQSPLRLDSEQILGDYFFDKADLTEAEKHYKAILDAPSSPVHDLARYKMGWIRINQDNHAEAVGFFEAAAASAPIAGVDQQKALNVKREALLDLVYSYTEARKPQGALNYFEKLSESRATFALALDKLGNRYFIKQQYEFAIPAVRKLMEVQPDPELDPERSGKLYDSLKAAKGKVVARPEDIRFIARSALHAKVDPSMPEPERKKQLVELEEMARDLATQLHVAAQKKDDRQHYLDAARAYEEYLALFRPKQHVVTIMKNRADALYAAKEFPYAARQFEELAQLLDGKDPKEHESALYGALLAHYSALKPGDVEELNAFEVADARQALKLLGAAFLSRYPRSEHAVEVKFNIARAYYEDGEYEKSAELFRKFALDHPEHKDAVAAGNLALDSHRQLNDFKGLEETGRALLGSRLSATFLADVRKILTDAKSEALGELALKSSEETGDVVEGLLKVAEENKGQDIGEKALYGAFAAARDKRDLQKERELGARIVADYPKSGFISDVLLTLGRHAAEGARFAEAAGWFEQVGQKLGADTAGLDGWLAGARLRLALGDYREAVRDLEAAADAAGARKSEVLVLLAEARMKMKEPQKARAVAEQALKLDKHNSAAAAVLAQVVAETPGERPEPLVDVLTAIANGPNGQTEETAKGLWHLGDMLFRAYTALPQDKVEEKVAALQQLEGVYAQAAQMGSPEWAVASLWRIALSFQHIADVVEATPLPDGLSAAEVQQFRAAVKEQVTPLKERAEGTFKACLSRASQLEVFSPAVIGCRERSDSASSPIPAPPPPRATNLDEVQKRAETQMDPASMEALGIAYLAAGQLSLAQLAFARAVELEEQRASAHSALGYAMLLQGDAMGARAEYGRALDADPTLEKARANLAALKCRFKDVEGAKRELSVVKDTSGLSGPEVDPEWRHCR